MAPASDRSDSGSAPAEGSADTTRSGFIAVVGRPNVGKSSLVNAICGHKVSIVSKWPQTTRHRIMGVLDRPDAQMVFVDTPGLHKPVTALGERVNATALESRTDADVVMMVVDATKTVGRGHRWVADRLEITEAVVVVNKVDIASPDQIAQALAAVGEFGAAAYFAVSARTGNGLDDLVNHLVGRLPAGPRYFPPGVGTDLAEEVRVAELVREQLLAVTRDELPYSIATRVVEWDGPHIVVEIIVERESQKGMVIGKGGAVLKRVGEATRAQLPAGTYLELRVKVDKNWQRRSDRIERLGY